jgi:large subunit ribosomal protein L15
MIHKLPSPKQNKKGKRVGRGMGSGKGGHTTGRGHKGQRSRSGFSKTYATFEGGQNPLSKRVPKRKGIPTNSKGVTRNFFRKHRRVIPVNLSQVADAFDAKAKVTVSSLFDKGLVNKKSHVRISPKIVFDKDIDSELNIVKVAISQFAQKAVEKAGGSVA